MTTKKAEPSKKEQEELRKAREAEKLAQEELKKEQLAKEAKQKKLVEERKKYPEYFRINGATVTFDYFGNGTKLVTLRDYEIYNSSDFKLVHLRNFFHPENKVEVTTPIFKNGIGKVEIQGRTPKIEVTNSHGQKELISKIPKEVVPFAVACTEEEYNEFNKRTVHETRSHSQVKSFSWDSFTEDDD